MWEAEREREREWSNNNEWTCYMQSNIKENHVWKDVRCDACIDEALIKAT